MPTFEEFQSLMRELYFSKDTFNGVEKTFLKLSEEIGELAEAILEESVDNIREEIADVIAWTVSIANLFGIDIDKAIYEKYPNVCPKCNYKPCKCK